MRRMWAGARKGLLAAIDGSAGFPVVGVGQSGMVVPIRRGQSRGGETRRVGRRSENLDCTGCAVPSCLQLTGFRRASGRRWACLSDARTGRLVTAGARWLHVTLAPESTDERARASALRSSGHHCARPGGPLGPCSGRQACGPPRGGVRQVPVTARCPSTKLQGASAASALHASSASGGGPRCSPPPPGPPGPAGGGPRCVPGPPGGPSSPPGPPSGRHTRPPPPRRSPQVPVTLRSPSLKAQAAAAVSALHASTASGGGPRCPPGPPGPPGRPGGPPAPPGPSAGWHTRPLPLRRSTQVPVTVCSPSLKAQAAAALSDLHASTACGGGPRPGGGGCAAFSAANATLARTTRLETATLVAAVMASSLPCFEMSPAYAMGAYATTRSERTRSA